PHSWPSSARVLPSLVTTIAYHAGSGFRLPMDCLKGNCAVRRRSFADARWRRVGSQTARARGNAGAFLIATCRPASGIARSLASVIRPKEAFIWNDQLLQRIKRSEPAG